MVRRRRKRLAISSQTAERINGELTAQWQTACRWMRELPIDSAEYSALDALTSMQLIVLKVMRRAADVPNTLGPLDIGLPPQN
jgi:hypothetical protein